MTERGVDYKSFKKRPAAAQEELEMDESAMNSRPIGPLRTSTLFSSF